MQLNNYSNNKIGNIVVTLYSPGEYSTLLTRKEEGKFSFILNQLALFIPCCHKFGTPFAIYKTKRKAPSRKERSKKMDTAYKLTIFLIFIFFLLNNAIADKASKGEKIINGDIFPSEQQYNYVLPG